MDQLDLASAESSAFSRAGTCQLRADLHAVNGDPYGAARNPGGAAVLEKSLQGSVATLSQALFQYWLQARGE